MFWLATTGAKQVFEATFEVLFGLFAIVLVAFFGPHKKWPTRMHISSNHYHVV